MKITTWVILTACASLLACCSPPRTIADLKTAIVQLRVAGAQDRTMLDDYRALLVNAQTRFELARSALPNVAVAACSEALTKAVDAQRVWTDTETIKEGLSPSTRLPLERLGVVKDDADFQRKANSFIPYEEDDPEDDTPSYLATKRAAGDDARRLLIKQSLDAAGQALAKAEATL